MDILNTVIALLGLLATVIIGTAKITWTIAQVFFRNTHHAKHYSKKVTRKMTALQSTKLKRSFILKFP